MIVSKTPLRVSFVGGGTDIPAWYERGNTGAVLSAAINMFIYVCLGRHWRPDRTRVSYSKTEVVAQLDYMEHELVRECMRSSGIDCGVEIATIADMPGQGTGLGSSSSLTVGLLNALSRWNTGHVFGQRSLAERAAHVEIGMLGRPIGKQDHYAAVFGGINFMRFNQDGIVDVEPLTLSAATQSALNSRFRLYHTGILRNSQDILSQQIANYVTRKSRVELFRLANLAVQARESLLVGNIEEFAYIVVEAWERKKAIYSGVSSPEIDAMYETAIKEGAIGGKLCGAGGGGFLLLYVANDEIGDRVFKALNLRELRVQYGAKGSEVTIV
jgi:D-glycero-alpha-D-manno-heptose-7-phosphate kinase